MNEQTNERTDYRTRRRVMMTTDDIVMYKQRVLTLGLLLGRRKPPPKSVMKFDASWIFLIWDLRQVKMVYMEVILGRRWAIWHSLD
jgi:hypothetical protein